MIIMCNNNNNNNNSTVELHLIRINWDGEPSGYAENPDNWIFLRK